MKLLKYLYFCIYIFTLNKTISSSPQNNFNLITPEHKDLLKTLPNQALVQGILEQRIRTEFILVETNPTYFLAKLPSSMALLIGKPNMEQQKKIIESLNKYSKITLLCSPELQPFFINYGYISTPRIYLELTPQQEKSFQQTCPQGCQIKPINSVDIFKKCLWFDKMATAWTTPECFIQNSFGYILINSEGIILAESYAAWISEKFCEIAVITHPNHQGRGYSSILSQYFIQECAKRNLIVSWSCSCDNIASLKVALKSNFEIKYNYAWLIKET